ncbi:MAG: hypothetical protein MZV63_26125 [Marinilabiliales bacterium]|nr:hypothetical protein [Marinilabiliales bacterium]
MVALIISGAGIAIPELTMLAGIFKKKIIIAFIIIVFISAVLSGLIFNLLTWALENIYLQLLKGEF